MVLKMVLKLSHEKYRNNARVSSGIKNIYDTI